MDVKEERSAPVDYWAAVWIDAAALRSVPDIYASIEGTVHRGDELHITEELDGLCRTDSGMWVLGLALKKQE